VGYLFCIVLINFHKKAKLIQIIKNIFFKVVLKTEIVLTGLKNKKI
tara:strand:- start:691 stop:828 length:138 start_codon:yes stop_codon:yes gene_type:complete